MSSIWILSIDPGTKGCAAILHWDGAALWLHTVLGFENTSNWSKHLNLYLHMYQPDFVVMEKVQAWRGQGAKSMFTFGGVTERAKTTIEHAGFEIEYVEPRTWQMALELPTHNREPNRAKRRQLKTADQKALVIKLFPQTAEIKADIWAGVCIGISHWKKLRGGLKDG